MSSSTLSDPTKWPAVEQLRFHISSDQVENFFIADAQTWTAFLESVPGFGGKMQVFNATSEATVTISQLVFWENYDKWKSIPADDLIRVQAEFVAAFGAEPVLVAEPDNSGWQLYKNSTPNTQMGCTLSTTIGDNMCSLPSTSCTPCEDGWVLYAALGVALLFILALLVYIVSLRRQLHEYDKHTQKDNPNDNTDHGGISPLHEVEVGKRNEL
jgi:uncharacterized protein (TIGR03792 family)